MIERYSRPELTALWSDASRFELWLDVELAACRAMERAGAGGGPPPPHRGAPVSLRRRWSS